MHKECCVYAPVGCEDVLEVVGRVDVGGGDVAEDARVLAVQDHGAVEHVEEQVDVPGVREVARHGLEHARDQTNPHELVHHVQTKQLLKY